jgi:hypothetical protein
MNIAPRRNAGVARTPILCLLAALAGAAAMFVIAQKDKAIWQAQLAATLEQARQAEERAMDPKEVEKLRAQVREAAELKKEIEDVHRLRGEVTQLRKDKAVFEQASAENAQLRSQAQLAQKLQLENQALRNQNQAVAQALQNQQAIGAVAMPANAQMAQKNTCIANLQQIDGAIQQWALENRKVAASPVEMRGVVEYLKGRVLPLCPAGGIYRPGANVSRSPTCTVPGHTL